MAVGIRSTSSFGSYGMGINKTGEIARTAWNKAHPDFIGTDNGTVGFDWKGFDESQGYTYVNGKVTGSGKNGYETKAERQERMDKRDKAWAKISGAIVKEKNLSQNSARNEELYRSTRSKTLGTLKNAKLSPQAKIAKANEKAKRTVTEKENAQIAAIAKKYGVRTHTTSY